MGKNDHIDYGLNNQRFAIIEDYKKILIIPALHLSQINFMGMKNRDEYLIWKDEQTTFTAVSKDLDIRIWSKLTGNEIECVYPDLDGDLQDEL